PGSPYSAADKLGNGPQLEAASGVVRLAAQSAAIRPRDMGVRTTVFPACPDSHQFEIDTDRRVIGLHKTPPGRGGRWAAGGKTTRRSGCVPNRAGPRCRFVWPYRDAKSR